MSNGRGESGRLSGKVAVVTGAGAEGPGIGNGRGAALLLAREGARVGVLDLELARAEQTRQLIAADGGEALAIECDVSRPADCREAVDMVRDEFGRIDILVNNVGVQGAKGTAVTVDLDEWNRDLAINLTSMVTMAKYCIPEMILVGGGAIVNIGSIAGLRAGYPDLLYPTVKGALVNMTRAMAAHHGRDGIRVNCVAPGMVYTPRGEADGMTPDEREERRLSTMLQTEGTGWDVGNAVLYLCSDEARWITAVTLPVDAGVTAM